MPTMMAFHIVFNRRGILLRKIFWAVSKTSYTYNDIGLRSYYQISVKLLDYLAFMNERRVKAQ